MRTLFLDAGWLRDELVLEEALATEDGAGGHSKSWNAVATLFGHVEPVRADSRFGAGQDHERVTHRVILRHREDVRSGMRFLKQGRVLAITNVHDADETGRYLICLAREEGR